jgi:hypothetical protein
LLKEIEWQSVFRNCAEVVRVKIVCREPSKVPAGRLFNFQGKLFQLQFTVELVTEKNGRDGGVQNKDLGDDDLENTNGGKSDDGNGANADSSKEHGNGNSSNHGGNLSGNQNFQRGNGAEGSKRILHEVSVLKGEEIFSLLLQNGAIGSADQFQWCDKVSENVLQEVENFWQSEEQSFVQEMQLSVEDGQVVQLPEDLFASKEDVAVNVEGDSLEAEQGKKQKTWGPVMATRQSNRIDRSMKIMDKAKEMKKKINLEIPASKKLSGIMKSNPFNLLHFDSLGDMASTVGVKIGSSILDSVVDDNAEAENLTSVNISCLDDNKSGPVIVDELIEVDSDQISIDSVDPPEQYITAHDSYDLDEGSWTKVCSRKRRKHPRKSFKC